MRGSLGLAPIGEIYMPTKKMGKKCPRPSASVRVRPRPPNVGQHWKGFALLRHMMYHVFTYILNIGNFTTHFNNAPKLSQ